MEHDKGVTGPRAANWACKVDGWSVSAILVSPSS
jgi:hypothetical protein